MHEITTLYLQPCMFMSYDTMAAQVKDYRDDVEKKRTLLNNIFQEQCMILLGAVFVRLFIIIFCVQIFNNFILLGRLINNKNEISYHLSTSQAKWSIS
jgi:hypothetical protein